MTVRDTVTEADGIRERAWNRALAQAEDEIRANEPKLHCGCSSYVRIFNDAIAAVRSLRSDLPTTKETSA